MPTLSFVIVFPSTTGAKLKMPPVTSSSVRLIEIPVEPLCVIVFPLIVGVKFFVPMFAEMPLPWMLMFP